MERGHAPAYTDPAPMDKGTWILHKDRIAASLGYMPKCENVRAIVFSEAYPLISDVANALGTNFAGYMDYLNLGIHKDFIEFEKGIRSL